MTSEKLCSVLESVLFVASESVNIKDLLKIVNESDQSEVTSKEIKLALGTLEEKYKKKSSGLTLMKLENTYQIVSKIDNNMYVEKIIVKRKKKPFSQAALEVLSIVAYSQPVTKIEIDEIRGVKSDSAVSSLVEHNLIYESGRLDKIGKPILYSTTHKFLEEFGIKSLKNLPKLDEEENVAVQLHIGETYEQ